MPRQNIIIIAALVVGFLLFRHQAPEIAPEIKIIPPDYNLVIEKTSGEKINLEVEIAESDWERGRGLSGHTGLDAGQGMIFIFDKPDYHPFWMQGMNFAIDIIWIGEDWRIVDITENALPNTYPHTFAPRVPARYVLEVNSGFTTQHDITVGQKVNLIKEK